MKDDADVLDQRELAVEPTKRWFNWWRFHLGKAERARINGQQLSDGEIVRQPNPYPSEDIARQRAAEGIVEMADQTIEQGGGAFGAHLEYLGAYPEGERP